MRIREICGVAAAAALLIIPWHAASAGDSYTVSLVNAFSQPQTYQLGKVHNGTFVSCSTQSADPSVGCIGSNGSKVVIKPVTSGGGAADVGKPGAGGLSIQLAMHGVDCGVNDDLAAPGKCGAAMPNPAGTEVNHVFLISVNAVGTDFTDVAGIKFYLRKGVAFFQSTGKNTAPGSIFGSSSSLVYNTPLGINGIKITSQGANPHDCDTAPLAGGNQCAGTTYAIAGVTFGNDPGINCTTDADCKLATLECDTMTTHQCQQIACTQDSDCATGGGKNGAGTNQCGSNGFCCDPKLDPTCQGATN